MSWLSKQSSAVAITGAQKELGKIEKYLEEGNVDAAIFVRQAREYVDNLLALEFGLSLDLDLLEPRFHTHNYHVYAHHQMKAAKEFPKESPEHP